MKKKYYFIGLVIILIVTIAITGFLRKSKFSKDSNIETFFDELLYEMVLRDPETSNFLYLDEEIVGKPIPNNKLTEIGREKDDENVLLYQEAMERLSAFDESELSSHELVQKRSIEWYLNSKIEEHNFYDYQFFLNYGGFQSYFFDLMNNFHKIESLKDAENFIERLRGYKPKMEALTNIVTSQSEKGLLPPKCILNNTTSIMNKQIMLTDIKGILEHPTYKSFVDRIQGIETIEVKKKEKIITEVENLMKESVYPAFVAYSEFVEELSQQADEDQVGLGRLPKGKEYYQYLLNFHTTTDYTADEIHAIGIQEVERVQSEIRVLLDEMGFEETPTILAMKDIDSRNFMTNTEETLKIYKDIIVKNEPYMSELFEDAVIPKSPVEVRPLTKEMEGTIGNCYQRPSKDGEIPGIFFVDLSYRHNFTEMETLLFHETIPGHHLQMAIQTEIPYIHPISQMTNYTGYVEGWGLYAEKLAYELGMCSSNESKLGYLENQLFRSLRLVVDTGIHHKNWSRSEAMKYMIENTGYSYEGEIDRYIQNPGQATGYKIGEIKILELREKAKNALGDRFDLKDFHTVILEDGNVPLQVLEYKVDQYIEMMK